jgi:hypothetical protein
MLNHGPNIDDSAEMTHSLRIPGTSCIVNVQGPGAGTQGQTYCCTNEFPRFRGSFALKDLLVAHKMRPGWPAVRAPIDRAIVIAAHRGPARSSCAVNRRFPARFLRSTQKMRPGWTRPPWPGRGLGGLQAPCRGAETET